MTIRRIERRGSGCAASAPFVECAADPAVVALAGFDRGNFGRGAGGVAAGGELGGPLTDDGRASGTVVVAADLQIGGAQVGGAVGQSFGRGVAADEGRRAALAGVDGG
ncbi:hypothetical protein FVA95_27635 [Pseudonocardia sp. EV170527-09]|uniref:hypothetical protein n=1 Tax=Pseudonocardia sp. EV170527-09 TaxID=2603411 RepID=UPI0011F39BEE|nr:hypothetical protein [Pseudonocardia sp. EV170527-09]KAA1011836.1 hypothetical protein FVA95_27635 [Pseudonocardia sp. EV170527-09]